MKVTNSLATAGAAIMPRDVCHSTDSTGLTQPKDANDYSVERRNLVERHKRGRFCSDEVLNRDEARVAARLNQLVIDEVQKYRSGTQFPPARPFSEVKTLIESSSVFKLIQDMPKGGLLRVHLSAAGSVDWIIASALMAPNCYVKWPITSHDWGGLRSFSRPEEAYISGHIRVSEAMVRHERAGGCFVTELRNRLSLSSSNHGPERVWAAFGIIFDRLDGFIRYQPMFASYLYDAFRSLWNDGVYHVELCDSLAALYTVDGTPALKEKAVVNELLNARSMMRAEHPEFDCRLIVIDPRWAENVEANLERAFNLQQLFPDFVIGYDLIGKEELHAGGAALAKAFALAKRLQASKDASNSEDRLAYYLHNGESAWADNDNLIDAALLQSRRIGHGFNLYRYPVLYPLLIANNRALEVCPISNQLLQLTFDLRSHPASGYLNAGVQCVLASDDPAIFGNGGLSYDFWEALMAWNLDLAALKKLARNSITHSGLQFVQKTRLMNFWEAQWCRFIDRQKSVL